MHGGKALLEKHTQYARYTQYKPDKDDRQYKVQL